MPTLPPPPAYPASRTALFLDLDGTIAEIVARPSDVAPVESRTALLSRLGDRLDGRLAILTGRDIEQSVTCIAAVHGLVRRSADGEVARYPAAEMGAARETLQALVKARKGLLLEDKGSSLALHYSQAPEAGEAVREVVQRIAASNGLRMLEGRMVAELRTPGPDKGDCLRAFMREEEFSGAVPVMLGDDVTDEDAFQAAAELGGYGILVGAPRATHAQYALADVSAVLQWLEEVAA
jgi:trehalose 6-phosphate phosphatase